MCTHTGPRLRERFSQRTNPLSHTETKLDGSLEPRDYMDQSGWMDGWMDGDYMNNQSVRSFLRERRVVLIHRPGLSLLAPEVELELLLPTFQDLPVDGGRPGLDLL